MQHLGSRDFWSTNDTLQLTATHYNNILHHTATHCNTLQHMIHELLRPWISGRHSIDPRRYVQGSFSHYL